MTTRIFNNDRLIGYDKISIGVYLILTVLVSNAGMFINNIEIQKSTIMGYSFMTPFLLYTFSYKSLRNIKMLIVWIGFSVFHLILYKSLITNQELLMVRGHAADGLQYTIYFVILYEILRIGHLKLFGYELVSLAAYGARTDLWDNRVIRWPDTLCFFIYFPIWILSATLK